MDKVILKCLHVLTFLRIISTRIDVSTIRTYSKHSQNPNGSCSTAKNIQKIYVVSYVMSISLSKQFFVALDISSRYCSLWYISTHAGVPGGLVGYPRACENQFREFNSHRVHILVGAFSCIKNDWQKARESELATFDENRRALGILNPMRDKN